MITMRNHGGLVDWKLKETKLVSFRLQIYDLCFVAVLAKATGFYLGTNCGGRSELDQGYSITQRVQCE